MAKSKKHEKTAFAKAMEEYARSHEGEFSARELSLKCINKLDKSLLHKCQVDAVAKLGADILRTRKDWDGRRINGSYNNGEKWVWKPYDAMSAVQIRYSFETLVQSSQSDLRSLVATEGKCNSLLSSRGAASLDSAWRVSLKKIMDGKEELGDKSA